MNALSDLPTTPPDSAQKEASKKTLKVFHRQLFELQHKFYADGRFGLLIILQGMDTSGKDSTIRHTLACMNPMGIKVKSFKRPTEEERMHDFLWRIYPHIPKRSMIQVFNRSYYEDVLVPAVNDSLPEEILAHRLSFIHALEAHLERNNIHILKFFLHISPEKQKQKVAKRKNNPRKKWKYEKSDEISPEMWRRNQEAYQMVIGKSNKIAWNVIPADKKWYRNYLVAKTILEKLESLPIKYPNE